MKKNTVDIPYEGTAGLPGQVKMQYPVRKNTLSSQVKYSLQKIQIEYPVPTNTISSCDKCNMNKRQIKYPAITNRISS